MTPVRGIVFDFDGTLADSEPAHERAIREVIEPLGWACDHRTFVDDFVGTSDRFCFTELARRHGETMDDERLASLLASKLARYAELLGAGEVRAYPGGIGLVRACAHRVPVAVCSGSRLHTVRPTLERFGVWELFDVCVTVDLVERPKPDPQSYLLAAERLGIAPGELVAIEDTDHGISSAESAGLRVIGLAHSLSPGRLSGADRVVDAIGEIGVESLFEWD
ncbi:MAG: HAD family phosphatase [Planctomycetota bacterium]